jgi:murein DD-endopeptidase MepM/ murein hydrolase activator NlpD
MDLAVPTGTEVKAIAAGKVLYTKMGATGYGYHVVINHGGAGSPRGGIVTLYAHNSKILVSEGQTVAQGEVIALSGSTGRSTGPHVHLEVIVDGVPMNPRNYL